MGTLERNGDSFWIYYSSKAMRAVRLIFAAAFWLYSFARTIYSKGADLSERVELLVGIVLLAGTVLLPFFGALLLKGETHDPGFMLLLVSAFVISLVPAVVFLCLIGLVLVVQH